MSRERAGKLPSACRDQCQFVVAALLAAVLTVSGCDRKSQRTVTLWHQMRPADRAMLDAQIDAFQQQHEDIRVRAIYKETEKLRSGMESAVLVGSGPELIYYPWDQLGVYDAIGALADLSPWFSESLIDQFDERTIKRLPAKDGSDRDALVFVGDRFGNHLALVYNKKLIENPPTTTDELVEMAVDNTVDENDDGRPEQYGLVWNYTEPFFVVPFLTGFGGWIFADQGDSATAEIGRAHV